MLHKQVTGSDSVEVELEGFCRGEKKVEDLDILEDLETMAYWDMWEIF